MQIDVYMPPPNHRLHAYVASIWRMDSQFSHTRETVLPKQNVDLLFNLGAPQHIVDSLRANQTKVHKFHVAGPQTGAFTVQPQGGVKLLGVSLKLDGCSALFALPLTELTDQTVEAHNLLPNHHFLWEQVMEAQSFDAQCNVLMQWLTIAFQPTPHLDLIQHACWSLREQPTSHTLDQLSAQLNFSSRHLRRIMLHHVGIGPAQYMRLSRFVKSLHLIPNAPSLTEIAYKVHYSDQAHFCRDFKEIAGMTPTDYRRRMSQVPGQIFSK